MAFGANLKAARDNKGLTQKQLALLIGAKHNSVSNWENDRNKPDPDTIERICSALNIAPNFLFGVSDPKSLYDLREVEPMPQMRKIPLLGSIACGEAILAFENIEDYINVPEDIHCDFVLRCQGDSMIGVRIMDGDIVYIRQQPDVENGEIAAVLLDGTDVTLKRVYKSGALISLNAENPAYPPIFISPNRQFAILGKVVGFTSIIK